MNMANISIIESFRNKISNLSKFQPTLSFSYCIKAMASIWGLFFVYNFLAYFLMGVDPYLYNNDQLGFGVFLFQTSYPFLVITFGLVNTLTSIKLVKNIKNHILYKKIFNEISGENFKPFFPDLYEACKEYSLSLDYLKKIVNDLVSQRQPLQKELDNMVIALDSYIKEHSVKKVNTDHYTDLLNNLKKPAEENIQFFQANSSKDN